MLLKRQVYACLLTLILFVPQAFADEWRATFAYTDGRAPVPFTLELSGRQGPIGGRTSEPNTFGQSPTGQLFANVRGFIDGSAISFTKTYDGTGGVNHSVEYHGTIRGDYMSGTWRIGNSSGLFSAARIR